MSPPDPENLHKDKPWPMRRRRFPLERHIERLRIPDHVRDILNDPRRREPVLLLLLPTLYFRFFPFILTHNSTPLSIWLAFVMVYIPGRVILGAWRTWKGEGGSSRRKRRKSELPKHEKGLSIATPPPSPPLGKRGNGAYVEKGKSTLRGLLWAVGLVWSIWTYTWGISSPFPTAQSVIASSKTLRQHQARQATYFIAASFYNAQLVLPSWTSELMKLIDVLGKENVYISLTENDSKDETASHLIHFTHELTDTGIPHNTNVTVDVRPFGDDPWDNTTHRMGYMANLRNGALTPLSTLGKRFDNVILLNDVFWHHTDVLKLIKAVGDNEGKKMACGIDLDGATLYDQWVLKDTSGRSVTGLYPYFTSSADKAAVRKGQVLDVGTCFNGIAVLDGDMFLPPSLRSNKTSPVWKPKGELRFRQPPSCIISECALLPLEITNTTGGYPIVVDSSVVVAYTAAWWRYYAVWMRTPVVRLWMRIFEERYWDIWWKLGMGEGLRWIGLDDGKEDSECIVTGWGRGQPGGVYKGGIRLKKRSEL